MGKTIEVNDTLLVTAQTVCKPCVWIERDGGGLLKVWPDEVRLLVKALTEAADVVTAGAPENHQIVKPVSPQEVDT